MAFSLVKPPKYLTYPFNIPMLIIKLYFIYHDMIGEVLNRRTTKNNYHFNDHQLDYLRPKSFSLQFPLKYSNSIIDKKIERFHFFTLFIVTLF